MFGYLYCLTTTKQRIWAEEKIPFWKNHHKIEVENTINTITALATEQKGRFHFFFNPWHVLE